MPPTNTELQAQGMKSRMLIASATGAVVLILITGLECGGGWIPSIIYGTTFWLWWTGVSYGLWRLGIRWPALLTLSLKATVLQVGVGTALAFAHRFGLRQMVHFIIRIWPSSPYAALANAPAFDTWHMGVEMLLYGVVWFACCAVYAQILARRSLELEKELANAHLLALQMQIEPHFLLNTLNSLTALVELDRKAEAIKTLERLNTILKMTLKRNAPGKIPLTQELEIVKSYLEIEQMRFADRLQIEMQVDPNALDAVVPSFILQPMIENAVRHGIAHCENHGRIETSVRREGDRVRLRVHDNGNGANGANGSSQAGFGIGLSNTTDRLAHFYKNDYDFGIRRPDSGGFEVVIGIPYERKEP
jgi:Histidine kinase